MIRLLYSLIGLPIKYLLGGIKVKVYMKSGNVVVFRSKCAEFDHKDNKITGYTLKKHFPAALWIQLDQIEAVIID